MAKKIDIVSISGESIEQKFTVIISIKKFLSRKEQDLYTDVIATPFDTDVKWIINVEPNGSGHEQGSVRIFLCNAPEKSNDVRLFAKWSIVDKDGRELLNRGKLSCTDYKNVKPAAGKGFSIVKRDQVGQLLANGALNIKCVLQFAQDFELLKSDEATKTITVTMTIKEFARRADKIRTGEIITPFDEDIKWTVDIYPRGHKDETKDYVALFVNNGKDRSNNVTMTDVWTVIDQRDGSRFERKATGPSDYSQVKAGNGIGWSRFLKRSELEQMLVDGSLRVRGVITICYPNKPQENLNTVSDKYSEILQKMMANKAKEDKAN